VSKGAGWGHPAYNDTVQIHTLSDFCEATGLPGTAVPDLVEVLQDRETAQLAQHEAKMRRLAGAPGSERIPLLDEDGEEFGRMEARIPAVLFWNQVVKRGMECWEDEEFMRDCLRDNPQFRIKTVNPRGRLVTGYRGPRQVVKRYG